ncbi:hypothetical protein H6P81_010602 [Aristolochia fimbriata]|uniref:Uncharacterized protein n=1 Tax=Aristolochia fimbriata TaxID=158543 RepID=A0AAV7EP85_ARIFI|nr:hypothetical protein H6P81_010602 [Aristolochia fimbriata]
MANVWRQNSAAAPTEDDQELSMKRKTTRNLEQKVRDKINHWQNGEVKHVETKSLKTKFRDKEDRVAPHTPSIMKSLQ